MPSPRRSGAVRERRIEHASANSSSAWAAACGWPSPTRLTVGVVVRPRGRALFAPRARGRPGTPSPRRPSGPLPDRAWAPREVGLDFGSGRLAVAYNAILGANVEVVQMVGADAEKKRKDYVSLKLGLRF
jgi:hypothetical protein